MAGLKIPRPGSLATMELYHRGQRVETKVHCMRLLGQRLMARDVECQVAELQVRIAAMNGYTARGMPVT